MIRFAVPALALAGLLLAGCSGDTSSIEGVWLLESFTEAGEHVQVQVGTNTAQQPWIEISPDSMTGKAGCNTFDVYEEDQDSYTYDNQTLLLGQSFMTAKGCMGEPGTNLMAVEELLTNLLWHQPDGFEVETVGDQMIWRADDTALFFRSVPEHPKRPPPPRQTAFGPLDCAPGYVAEQTIDGDDRPTEQILLDNVPDVVRTAMDLDFAPSAPDDWFWLGYDETGTLIAFIARGDVEPPIYQIATCRDR
ncbi:MAG: hypothetical protein GY926_01970 [bacterium]|nr:hypothetical protein [bacterium]MCP4963981.1 hypothetical protein [bacterium]